MFAFSQEYHFDYYIKYRHELKRNFKKRPEILDIQNIINSKDHSYKIFFSSDNGKTLIATISDYKNYIQHYFDVKNTKFPLKEYDFYYKYSKKIPSVKKQFKEESKRRFFKSEFIEKQNDSLFNYTIKEFTNEKMRNPRISAEVVFADFKDDLSFIGLQFLFDYQEIYSKLKFENNYILKSATSKYEGLKTTLTLDAIEPQNFDIKINQNKLKFINE